MAINSSTRFGVVYSTPKDFIVKIGSKDSAYTDGKLFVLHGDAEGAITQGIYMVEQNNTDPDGSLNIQMLSSGAYASSSNAGLMSAADVATLSNALSKADASNTYLKINDASFFRTIAVKNGSTSAENIVADSSRDTLTITAGSNIKLTSNAATDTLTIEATDTIYTGTSPINVSGTTISHANSGVTAGRYGDTSSARTLEFGGKFKVVDVSVNAFGHVTKAASYELTLPSKPATAGTADEAKKTTGTLTIKGNGTSVGTFNGSAAEEVNIKTGNASTLTVTGTADGSIAITPVTAAVASNSNALTTGAQVATYVSTQLGNLAGALLYQGTVSNANELNSKAKTQGHVWISSSKDWEYTDVNNQKYKIEIGDMFICNGTGWNIVSSEFDVSTYSKALSWDTDVSIAVVDGVTIKAKLPANPNTDEKVKAATSDGTFYLIGHDDATGIAAETTYKNASVYVNDGHLFSGGAKVLTSYTEKYTGTVTSITPGTGLTNGTTENAITSTGTLNLKTSSATEIGGIIASNVLTTNVTLTSANGATESRYYGVQVDKSGKAFVNVPWVDTWREVYVGNTKVLTSTTDSSALKFVNGTNITATWNSTNKTIQFDASGLATDAEVATAKSEAIEAATIYWETL